MVKLSRYLLVLIGITVAAIAIPKIYWTIFREAVSVPNVMYSQIIDDFIIAERAEDGSTVYKDSEGNTYTGEEAEQLLPLLSHRQLYADGTMPDSIRGVAIDHENITRHRSTYTFMPRNIDTPQPVLWPMLESQPGRPSLSLPEDFFHLKDDIRFIVAATNAIDKEKSRRFNDALIQAGFSFPADIVAGIPTARKSRDEGYFVKDSEGDLFHIKMIRGEPHVNRIDIPRDTEITFIECVDMATREFYAYLYTSDNALYILLSENYKLQQLPAEGFDRKTDRLRVRHDMFGKTISVIRENSIHVSRVSESYELTDTYETSWDPRHERSDHKMFASVFPFELRLEVPESNYVGFALVFSHGFTWLIANVLLVGVAIWFLKRKDRALRKHLPDLLVILLTGVFGFIAVRVFPNKFYDSFTC